MNEQRPVRQGTALLRHNARHAPPEITPSPPPSFPRIRIHNLKRIPQPRLSEQRVIWRCRRKTHARKRSPTRLVQIHLIRFRERPRRKLYRCCIRSCGYGGVIPGDEISPYGLKCVYEVGTLGWEGRTEVGGDIEAVFGADDGVLVFEGGAGVVGEGFGEPVGGADECCFGVEVLGKW